MRLKIVSLFVLMLFALWGACQTEISLPRPFGDNFIESELIEEVTYIPLTQERMGTISPDMELRFENNFYFILDNKFTQCVYRYSPEGELINTICEEKKAEGEDLPELKNPATFNINPYYEQVEIYNFQESTVKRYSFNGTKIDQISFPVNPADFIRDKAGNYWIYTGWNHNDTQYRLIKCDKNGKIIDRKMRLVTRFIQTMSYAFSLYNDKILMWELLGNATYTINNDDVTERYNFFYGINNLPPNFHIVDTRESLQRMNNLGYYSVKKYLENDDFAYFFLNYTKTATQERELLHIIHDKKAKQIFKYTENAAIGAFDKAQAITDKNELVFLVAPRKMRQLLSGGVDFVPEAFYDLEENVRKIRYTMVLKIKLKSLADQSSETGKME